MDSLGKKMIIIAVAFIIVIIASLVFVVVYGDRLPLCESGHEEMNWNIPTKTYQRAWVCDSR